MINATVGKADAVGLWSTIKTYTHTHIQKRNMVGLTAICILGHGTTPSSMLSLTSGLDSFSTYGKQKDKADSH